MFLSFLRLGRCRLVVLFGVLVVCGDDVHCGRVVFGVSGLVDFYIGFCG